MIRNIFLALTLTLGILACTHSMDIKQDTLTAVRGIQNVNGSGTAFAISQKYLVSAAHVCNGDVFAVDKASKELYQVVAMDEIRDLCLLRRDERKGELPLLKIAKQDPKEGERLTVIGYPFMVGRTITEGYLVHAVDAIIPFFRFSSALVSPGNSGGPVLNKAGEVVGVIVRLDARTSFGIFIARETVEEFVRNATKVSN